MTPYYKCLGPAKLEKKFSANKNKGEGSKLHDDSKKDIYSLKKYHIQT